jgi:hypothetical protein
MTDVSRIRAAIINTLPRETSNYGEVPDQRYVYLPRAHVKALELSTNLVVGSRGVGKTFWTAALKSPEIRNMLRDHVRELDNVKVGIGFSVKPMIEHYPEKDVISKLLGDGYTPYEIWRAVVLKWVADLIETPNTQENWSNTVAWVRANPEELARLMEQADQSLQSQGQKGLIIFDALDYTSNNWETMDLIVRDLLRVVLWLKSYRRLHAKVFLREDQFQRTVTDFPDASKILATKTDLTWQPHDLHGLLWQWLCNAPDEHGVILRNIYHKIIGKNPEIHGESWLLEREAKQEGEKQRKLFAELAGPWMGKDRRRGVPYVWTVSHLADAKGRTSPRSFLKAIRVAAEDSDVRYADHSYALHYESIKRGVQDASQIRITEVAEDYPWVRELCEKLIGMQVPSEYAKIEERWVQEYPNGPKSLVGDRLPPQHLESGWDWIIKDLERIGIFERMNDGRFNMPDLYRVGFGLGRKGGVRPVKRG